MAWRLRLLDGAGDVVGWATLDPHEFWVGESLPDADFVRAMLSMAGTDHTVTATTEYDEEADAYRMGTEIRPLTDPPEERLKRCGSSIAYEGWVADYELIEE